MSSLTRLPDAQASSLVPSQGLTLSLEGLSFLPRALARIIDLLVHYAASFIAGFLFTMLFVIAAGGRAPNRLMIAKLNHFTVMSFMLAILGSIAYHTICEGFHGSSLGKLIFSMVVVQEDGSPCRPGSALIRSIAFLVDGIFFGVVGYMAMERTVQEQRYGDEWAHTIVCKRSYPPAASLRSNGRFAAVFFVALLVDISFAMIALVTKITG